MCIGRQRHAFKEHVAWRPPFGHWFVQIAILLSCEDAGLLGKKAWFLLCSSYHTLRHRTGSYFQWQWYDYCLWLVILAETFVAPIPSATSCRIPTFGSTQCRVEWTRSCWKKGRFVARIELALPDASTKRSDLCGHTADRHLPPNLILLRKMVLFASQRIIAIFETAFCWFATTRWIKAMKSGSRGRRTFRLRLRPQQSEVKHLVTETEETSNGIQNLILGTCWAFF